MQKKRWVILVFVSVIAASMLIVRSVRGAARSKREVTYQVKLRSYSESVHPGMTRKSVEDYLRLLNTKFVQEATKYGYPDRNEFQEADLVEIGQETPPWYCSNSPIYVAFEFVGALRKLKDSDVLERVELYRPDTGCL